MNVFLSGGVQMALAMFIFLNIRSIFSAVALAKSYDLTRIDWEQAEKEFKYRIFKGESAMRARAEYAVAMQHMAHCAPFIIRRSSAFLSINIALSVFWWYQMLGPLF
jgi:hypothetical protein